MCVLIIGGSGSGKSEYAEQRLQAAGGATLDIIKAVAVAEIKKGLEIER